MIRAAISRPPLASSAGADTMPGPASLAPQEAQVSLPAGPRPEPPAAMPPPELEEPPAAVAEEAPPSAARAPSFEFVRPTLVRRPTPRYPVAARRHGRGATVTVRVRVGPDGQVQEVERTGEKAGMGFDRAAEEAARRSIWEPGTRDGEPAAMWTELRFEFRP